MIARFVRGEYRVQSKYLLDDHGNGQLFNRKLLIHAEKSDWQSIEISELEILGRVLVLDDIIQLSELDKDRYHETITHPIVQTACKLNDTTAEFLILGGGDGIIASELLKYPVAGITLVDIDERVTALSRSHLNLMNNNSLDSPLVDIKNIDALTYVQNCDKEKYDAIFLDITDPHPNSPSASLLGSNAIKNYKECLSDDGIIVSQTDNPFVTPQHMDQLKKNFAANFKHVGVFAISAMTFSGAFSFVWASDTHSELSFDENIVSTNWLTYERFKFCKKMLELI